MRCPQPLTNSTLPQLVWPALLEAAWNPHPSPSLLQGNHAVNIEGTLLVRKAAWWGRLRGADLNTQMGAAGCSEAATVFFVKILKALLLMTHTSENCNPPLPGQKRQHAPCFTVT